MTDFPITIVARILAAVCILKTMCAVTFAVVQVVIMFVLVAMRESYMADKQFTLEEITASWLGTGKKIPIGQMMAWLIKEVERLHNQICNFSEPIRGEVSDVDLYSRLEGELSALWHFATCPFDHCQRCIEDEVLIKGIGKRLRGQGLTLGRKQQHKVVDREEK